MEIIKLTHKAANCYLIKCGSGWMMIDAGWPDTLHNMFQLLKQNSINIKDIKYLIVTHFHPDHGGLVQDFKELGIKLILHESQIAYVDKLNEFFKRNLKVNFKDIEVKDNLVLTSKESREFLNDMGIMGEIIHTPGHSDDSITLVIDEYCAFTGDLPELSLVEAYEDQTLKDSWNLIQGYNVKKIYPAHGNSYNL